MTNYRRADFPSGYYFFTVVTHRRRKILTTELARDCLRKAWQEIQQRRFWEHQIRDEDDLQRHIDYIHYNPVKHGLVNNVED